MFSIRRVISDSTRSIRRFVSDRFGSFHRILPDRIRGSYVAKFGLVILTVLVVTAGVAGFFYVDISDRITEETQNEMQVTAEFEADDVGTQIENYEATVTMLASNERFVDGSPNEIQTGLTTEIMWMTGDVEALHYIDYESDTIEYSSEHSQVGDDVSEFGFSVHTRDRSDVTEYEYDEADFSSIDSTYTDTYEHDGETQIAFLSPISESDGTHAIMMIVSVEEMSSDFSDPIEGSHTEVIDGVDGDVMVSQESESLLSTYRGGDSEGVIERAENGSGTIEFDGTDEVAAYAPVSGTDWVLVTQAPQSNAYALVDNVANSLIALIAVAMAGFLVIGATIGRSTANALGDLADDATALSNGETDIEIEDSGRIDEVGQVRSSFDDIRAYLETATAQSDAIARQEFDDPALDEDVPGTLGASLQTMGSDLESYIDDVEAARAQAEQSSEDAASARREAEELAERLEQKATEFGRVMGIAADGDLTQRLDDDVDNEALAEIAAAF
ncbi:HAMP domain-containing protein, partial [Natrarchaeobius halalkaliphilus]